MAWNPERELGILVRAYKLATLEIVKRMEEMTRAGNSTRHARASLTEITGILGQLDDFADEWIEQNIPRAYRQGWDDTFYNPLISIPKDFAKDISYSSFAKINRQAVEVVAYNLQDMLLGATQMVGRQSNDVFRHVGLMATQQRLITGEAVAKTTAQMKERFVSQGIAAFEDKLGRTWDLDTYCEMVARTTTREATSLGTINRLTAGGYDLVQISEHEPTCELCAPLAGKVYSLSGDTPGYPRYDDFIPVHPNCYSKDTEVYTERGWIKFQDAQVGEMFLSMDPETRIMEWVPAIKAVKVFSEKMISFKNNQFDLLVTPNHRMLYQTAYDRKKKNDRWIWKTAEETFKLTDGCFLQGANWEGSNPKFIEIDGTKIDITDYAKLMGWYLSEGSVDVVKWPNVKIQGRFCISQCDEYNPEKHAEIEALIKRIGWKYSYSGGRFVIYRGYEYFKQFKKSNKKYVPEIIKQATPEIIQIFLDAFIKGDGHVRKKMKKFKGGDFKPERIYTTSSERLAADIGELLLKIGRRPSFYLSRRTGKEYCFKNGAYKTKHDIWYIREGYRTRAWMCNIKKEYVDYNDYAYDVELEKYHVLLVRRNGKIAWSGNCLHVLWSYQVQFDPDPEKTKAFSNTSLTEDPRSEAEKRAYKATQDKKRQERDLREQYKRYVARLGEGEVGSIQGFAASKKADSDRWQRLQGNYRSAGRESISEEPFGTYTGKNPNLFIGDVYTEDREILVDFVRENFEENISLYDIARATGVHEDEDITLFVTRDDTIAFKVEGRNYTMKGYIEPWHGDKHIYIDLMKSEGGGHAAKTIAMQSEHLQKLGITKINLEAAGIKEGWNGYYTWPRLGFNGNLDMALTGEQKQALAKTAFKDAKTLQDIMMHPQGASWWKENGSTFMAEFDVTPGSISRQILETYLREKGL